MINNNLHDTSSRMHACNLHRLIKRVSSREQKKKEIGHRKRKIMSERRYLFRSVLLGSGREGSGAEGRGLHKIRYDDMDVF